MKHLAPAYVLIAIVVLNTLALLVFVNGAAALWLRFQRKLGAGVRAPDGS